MTDLATAPPTGRRLVIRFEPVAKVQSLWEFLVGGILGGGLSVEIFRRWASRRERLKKEPLQLTARILDDGDQLRTRLLEEAHSLRIEVREWADRAHRAELELALGEREISFLKSRLDRKDERLKAIRRYAIHQGVDLSALDSPADRRREDDGTPRDDEEE